MGYSIAWLSIAGPDPRESLHELGLAVTGESERFPRSRYYGRMQANGRYLLVASGCDDPIAGASTLATFSRDRDVVAGIVEEHVMYFRTEEWRDGRRLWHVEHDCQQNREHLVAAGELPEQYAEIRDRLVAEQAAENEDAEDEFEAGDVLGNVPLDVAALRSGFHYEDPEHGLDGWGKHVYDVVGPMAVPLPPAAKRDDAKPWWKLW